MCVCVCVRARARARACVQACDVRTCVRVYVRIKLPLYKLSDLPPAAIDTVVASCGVTSYVRELSAIKRAVTCRLCVNMNNMSPTLLRFESAAHNGVVLGFCSPCSASSSLSLRGLLFCSVAWVLITSVSAFYWLGGAWGVGRGVWGVGCGAWGVGCGAWGVGRGVWGVGRGVQVWGVGCGAWDVGRGVWGVGCRCGVWGVGCGVWGVGCGVWGVGRGVQVWGVGRGVGGGGAVSVVL